MHNVYYFQPFLVVTDLSCSFLFVNSFHFNKRIPFLIPVFVTNFRDILKLNSFSFWHATTCHWVHFPESFEEIYCLHLQGLRGPRRKCSSPYRLKASSPHIFLSSLFNTLRAFWVICVRNTCNSEKLVLIWVRRYKYDHRMRCDVLR
jgi:hypothetical protein